MRFSPAPNTHIHKKKVCKAFAVAGPRILVSDFHLMGNWVTQASTFSLYACCPISSSTSVGYVDFMCFILYFSPFFTQLF